MKYLVLETHTSYAIVLDEAGNFLMAANLGYAVGQSLEHVELLENPAPARAASFSDRRRVIALVAAVAACLMFFLVSALQPQVYATVIMSINPKLQLDLNRDGCVMRVVGLNEEGKAIAKKINMKRGEPVAVAVADITDNAIRDGYLTSNGEVKLLVETSDTQFYKQMEETLEKSVKETIDDRVAAVQVKVDQRKPQTSPSPTPTVTPSDTPTSTGGETPTNFDDATPAMVGVPPNSPVVELTPSPTPRPMPVYSPSLSPSPSPSPKANGSSPTPTSSPTATPPQTPSPSDDSKDIENYSPTPSPSSSPTADFIQVETPSLPTLNPSPSHSTQPAPSISVEETTPTPKPTHRPGRSYTTTPNGDRSSRNWRYWWND